LGGTRTSKARARHSSEAYYKSWAACESCNDMPPVAKYFW
jgi:hypothetical protein